jgi:hypoxanthine phosphoribosyltransferase
VKTLKHILEKYIDHKVLLVDDINDTGTTLQAIENVIYDDALESGNDPDLKIATLLSKSQSEYQNVDFYARELTPDNDPWIVFPYEQWWNFNNEE